MKPDCFTNYSPMRGVACASCAWRGPCAVRTTIGPFTFTAHPIYPREIARPDLVPVTRDTDMVAAVLKAASAARFRVVNSNVLVHGTNKKIARVDPWVGGTVILRFPGLSLRRLYELPASARAAISGDVPTNRKWKLKLETMTRKQLIQRRRLAPGGSKGLLSSVEDAVELLIQVAREVFGDHRA